MNLNRPMFTRVYGAVMQLYGVDKHKDNALKMGILDDLEEFGSTIPPAEVRVVRIRWLSHVQNKRRHASSNEGLYAPLHVHVHVPLHMLNPSHTSTNAII